MTTGKEPRLSYYGGGLILTAGWAVVACLVLALADGGNRGLDPVVLQVLNILNTYDILALVAGFAIMLLGGAGAMIPLSGPLRWLGWAALPLAIVLFTPIAFVAFIVSLVWIVVVSVLLFLRSDDGVAPAGTTNT